MREITANNLRTMRMLALPTLRAILTMKTMVHMTIARKPKQTAEATTAAETATKTAVETEATQALISMPMA